MARREPHWVKLFLRELERTGNVRISAERAGVDYTSAYQRRKRHAGFAERWALRLAAFRSGSGKAGALDEREGEQAPSPGSAPPSPSSPSPTFHLHDAAGALKSASPARGEELLRPDGKVIKGSEARWGKRAEEVFLTELTVSANVRRAAEAAGFSTTAVYKRRLKDRHFTAAWDAAVETGKARVQTYLVEAATRTFDPDELPIGDEREIPKVSISEAINIAKLRAAGPARPDEEAANYDDDYLSEVRERILDKLDRLREREIEEGWTPYELAEPLGKDGSITEVWVPPGYKLVRVDEAGAGLSDGVTAAVTK